MAPSGRIYPCAEMIGDDESPQLAVGHVDTGIDLERVSALRERKQRVYEACADCALRPRCQNYCGCRHLAASGKLGELTSQYCEIEARTVQHADRVAETLWTENCVAFRVLRAIPRRWRKTEGIACVARRDDRT